MRPLTDLADVAPAHLTMRALAAYLGYEGQYAVDSAQRFVARHGLRRYWRSARCAMVARADVDAVMAGQSARRSA
jgi:hypothetical protein